MGECRHERGPWKYLVLAAGFWNMLICYGTLSATGVFIVEWMVYYDIGAAAASSIALGRLFVVPLLSPFAGVMCQRFGCGRVCILGGVISSISMGTASFSPNLPFLIAMMCVLGFGQAFVLIPCYAAIGYYFRGHVAFANGVMMSGISAALLAVVPLIQFLCTFYGWRGAMLVMSAVIANVIVSGMIFRPTEEEKANIAKVRGRRNNKHEKPTNLPLHEKSSTQSIEGLVMEGGHHLETDSFMHEISQRSAADISIEERTHPQRCVASMKNILLFVFAPVMKITRFLQVNLLWNNPRLGSLCLAGLVAALGNFSHIVYLISKVIYDLGISKQDASLLMATIGLSGIIGGVAHGPLIDKGIVSVHKLIPTSLAITGVSSLLVTFANTFATQIILAITFGIGNSMFMSLCPMYTRILVGQGLVASGNGLRIMVNGLGNAIGTVSMGALYDMSGSFNMVFYVAGGFSFLACAGLGALACYIEKISARDQHVNDN